MAKRRRHPVKAAATEHHLPLALCVPYLTQAHLLRQLSRRWRDSLLAPGEWSVGLRPAELQAVPTLGAHHARVRGVSTLARLPGLAPHLRRLELRLWHLHQLPRSISASLAQLRQLEALRIELPEAAGGSALLQLKRLLWETKTLKRLRFLEVHLPQAFAFPCWLDPHSAASGVASVQGRGERVMKHPYQDIILCTRG